MPERVGLGEFELLVMAAVLRLGDEAYGARVMSEIEAAGRRATVGAVYTTLKRLEERGMVSSREGQPTPVRGGRAKRYFKVEAAGREEMVESLSTLGALLQGTALAFA